MGERGTLISDGKTSRLRYLKGRGLPRLVPTEETIAVDRRYGVDEKLTFTEIEMPATTGTQPAFYDFLYDSLRKKKPLLVTPESVRKTMEVAHRARRSSRF
jgi:hypothetical protein